MKNIVILILFIAFLNGCQRSSGEIPAENAFTKKIDSYLQETVDRLKIPGLTVAATRNDSVVYVGAFGVRSVATGDPIRPDNNFHWASVSKTFVAMAIMQLAEKGKINPDERLISYLPYFKQKTPDYKDITIRQMLNHTSGIGDVADYEWDKPQYDETAPEQYIRSLANDTMLFSPGKYWSYSNTAYDILGVVITKVSGMPFETYIRKYILEPLEMDNSSFIYPEIPDSLRVKGHSWAAKPVVSKFYPYNRIHAPSSTLNSNVLEMTHYAMANLHRGKYRNIQLLSDSSYNSLWINSVSIKDMPHVGLSWFLEEYRGLNIVNHGGGDTGFRSFLLLVPEKNISVEVVSNYELCPVKDLAFVMLDMLLDYKPEIIRRQIGFAFAEILEAEGLENAKDFYKKTEKDSIQYKYYIWKEEEGAMAYAGWLLLRQGMLNEALEIFKFDLELNPGSGHAYGNLGIAYARSGNKKLARLNLEKCIEFFPDEGFYKEELKKLGNP